jgi:lysophospholipase L1-like esterase
MDHSQHRVPSVSRRQFLGTSLVAGGAAAAAGTAVLAPRAAGAAGCCKLKPKSVILFQGDSITDAGRSRKATGPNRQDALGRGYPLLAAAGLLADHAGLDLKVYNRGISGNKVPDLAARWDEDCLELKPSVLSILIGVNDIWHKLAGRYDGTVKDYETGYRALLQRTLQALPNVRIVICEPFVLRCGAVDEKWFPEFDQRRAAARKLAEEMKLTLVPFQSMFDKAVDDAPPAYWAGDGVHPTLAGHMLMAQTWRKVVGL